jgi:hypothetical protein
MNQATPRPEQSMDKRALRTFRSHGGMMRTGEALSTGIHPATLYRLCDHGIIVPLASGLYRLEVWRAEEDGAVGSGV